jgi:hypothetical protein
MTKALPLPESNVWNEEHVMSGINACNDPEIRLAFYQTLEKKIMLPTFRLSDKFVNAIISDVNSGKSANTPEVDVAALSVIQSAIHTLEHPLSAGLARKIIGYEKSRSEVFTACAPNEKGDVTAARAQTVYAHFEQFAPFIDENVAAFISRHYMNEQHKPVHLASNLLLIHMLFCKKPEIASPHLLEMINTTIASTKDCFLREFRDNMFEKLDACRPEVIDHARIGYRLRKATAALNALIPD